MTYDLVWYLVLLLVITPPAGMGTAEQLRVVTMQSKPYTSVADCVAAGPAYVSQAASGAGILPPLRQNQRYAFGCTSL